jgi:hypothetical protein
MERWSDVGLIGISSAAAGASPAGCQTPNWHPHGGALARMAATSHRAVSQRRLAKIAVCFVLIGGRGVSRLFPDLI